MFRRKQGAEQAAAEDAAAEAPEFDPTAGPFDIDDVDVDNDGVTRVDLGGLLVPQGAGRELRLQVDQSTEEVQSVLVAGPDGALELKPFAAPRNGNLWSEIYPQIAADVARRGGTATPRDGRHGTELMCVVPVQTAEGQQAQQQSRVVGVNGKRWLLRATFLGRPATDPESAGEWEDVLAGIVVRRGTQAMPVGDPIPLKLPPQARRTS